MDKEKLKLNSLYGQMGMGLYHIKQAMIEAHKLAYYEAASLYAKYKLKHDVYGDSILTEMAEGDYLKAYGKWEGLGMALNIINEEL